MTENHILDMTATPAFRTATSMSFSLSRQSRSLCSNRRLGWIDVHFPCEGHIKARIRVLVPKEYHEHPKMVAIIKAVLSIAGILDDETYEVTFIDAATVTEMEQSTDRQGVTDRLH